MERKNQIIEGRVVKPERWGLFAQTPHGRILIQDNPDKTVLETRRDNDPALQGATTEITKFNPDNPLLPDDLL